MINIRTVHDYCLQDYIRKTFHAKVRLALFAMGCVLTLTMLIPKGIAKDSKPFKTFKLKTLDGQKKTLTDYAGKLTMIAFFYPRCPHCRASLPHIQRMYDKYKDQGLSAVLINVVEDEDKLIPRYLEEQRITIPVLTGAWQPALVRNYDLKSTPTHFLLDGSGTILLRQDGYRPGDEKVLESKIMAALHLTP